MSTLKKTNKSGVARSTAPAPITPLQVANGLMKEYAELSGQLATVTATAKAAAAPINSRLAEIETELHTWAVNPAHQTLFGGNKLMKTDWGMFGFKAGTKRLKWDLEKTPEGYEATVAKLVQKHLPTAIKVDEAKVAKLWGDAPKLAEALTELGASVDQPDNFTITMPKAKA